MKAGQSGWLASLELSPADNQRLMEMGLTPGIEVRVVRMAPMGDPIEIAVRGSQISIRKKLARHIHIQPAGKDAGPS